MFHVDVSGGLVLARFRDFRTTAEAEAFRGAIQAAVSKAKPAVICADWRYSGVVSPEIAEVMTSMLRGANPMLRRSSILLAVEQATFNLQSERLVREADNPNRRTFRKPTEMLAWIGELLTSDEREAARRFLDEGNGLAKP